MSPNFVQSVENTEWTFILSCFALVLVRFNFILFSFFVETKLLPALHHLLTGLILFGGISKVSNCKTIKHVKLVLLLKGGRK